MKKNKPFGELFYRSLKKILLTMRIGIILMIIGILQARATDAYSQKTRLSLNFSDAALVSVLDKIEDESEFFFMYNEKLLDTERKVTINAKDQLIDAVLDDLFSGTDVKFTIIDRKIILAPDYLSDAPVAPVNNQQRTVTGTITDEAGSALPGVNIMIEGTTIGVLSNSNGEYSISVPNENVVLVFSFIGFQAQKVSTEGRSTISPRLISTNTLLDEVVVTALGIKREKKALSYSISDVAGENLTKAMEINLGPALSGKIAGVVTSSTAGGPGSSSRIIIRGNGSISGDNQPLIVVNGIPISNSNQSFTAPQASTLDRGNGLTSINPNDIETISVLKGGSSAALYGSRAANGVILITTKSGKAQQGIGVEFNSTFMMETPSIKPDWQYEYGSGSRGLIPGSKSEAIANSRFSWGAKLDGSQVIQPDGESRPYSAQKDNIKNYYNTGTMFFNSLALTGGKETANFRFSASNMDNNGLVPNNTLNIKGFNLNINATLAKKIEFEANTQYSIEEAKNRIAFNNVTNNPNAAINELATNIDVRTLSPGYDVNGNETEWTDLTFNTNPYFVINKVKNEDKTERVISSFSIKYNFNDFLYARGRLGTDFSDFKGEDIAPWGVQYKPRGNMVDMRNDRIETNAEAILGFNKKFNSISLNIVAGGNQMHKKFDAITLTSDQFNVPFTYFISNGSSPVFTETFEESAINSLFGSADIGYKSYLYLTLTGRQDWYSTLSIENNSLFYPSVGLSLLVSEVWKSKPAWMNYSKIRGSYAQVGGGANNPYGLDLTYSAGTVTHFGQSLMSISSSKIPSNLLPYTSTTAEFGIEMRLFNDRLGADITVYDRITNNDIVSVAVSPSSSYANAELNVGKMRNRGIELLLTASPVKLSNGFNWDMSYTLAYNENTVIKLAEGLTRLSNGGGTRSGNGYVYSFEGQPFGMVSGFKFKEDDNGTIIYNEVNGMPLKSDFMALGRGVPPLTMGLSNNFSYKNLSLDFLIDCKFGSVMYSATNDYAVLLGKDMRTVQNNVRENGVTVTGVDTKGLPFTMTHKAQNFYQGIALNYTDPFVHDNGFIKLRDVTLGYFLPQSILSKTPFKFVRLSLVARNLLFLYNQMPNVDPESVNNNGNGQGVEGQGMPATRTYGLNLMLRF